MKNHRSWSYAIFACFLARVSLGDVLFNTFGTNDSFDMSSAYSITWKNDALPSGSFGIANAARFQFGLGSYALTSVSLAMGYTLGTNNLKVSIMADNGGQPTGPLLETVVSHPSDIIGDSQVVTYRSSLDPIMVGGSSYWLIVEPADLNLVNASNDGAYNWFAGFNLPIGTTAYHAFDFSSQAWLPWQVSPNNLLPAFRIEGASVPEPSALLLVTMGGATLLGLYARKRTSQRRP